MDISPQRVRTAEFKTAKRGLDADEVRSFLNEVAAELERAQNQSTAMEARARAAVARLQEISDGTTDTPVQAAVAEQPDVPVTASVDESETISRTLLLAQRTADTTIAEAKAEAERLAQGANDEAAKTLDSTREMSARLLEEARVDARRLGAEERVAVQADVDSLSARRTMLKSDVESLEQHLADERSRLREAATSLIALTEKVPGGLGEVGRPALSEAADDTQSADVADADDRDGGAVDDSVTEVMDVTVAGDPDDDTRDIAADNDADNSPDGGALPLPIELGDSGDPLLSDD